jgi:hypothetical protein
MGMEILKEKCFLPLLAWFVLGFKSITIHFASADPIAVIACSDIASVNGNTGDAGFNKQ